MKRSKRAVKENGIAWAMRGFPLEETAKRDKLNRAERRKKKGGKDE